MNEKIIIYRVYGNFYYFVVVIFLCDVSNYEIRLVLKFIYMLRFNFF